MYLAPLTQKELDGDYDCIILRNYGIYALETALREYVPADPIATAFFDRIGTTISDARDNGHDLHTVGYFVSEDELDLSMDLGCWPRYANWPSPEELDDIASAFATAADGGADD